MSQWTPIPPAAVTRNVQDPGVTVQVACPACRAVSLVGEARAVPCPGCGRWYQVAVQVMTAGPVGWQAGLETKDV